jgi:hypothetical protein
MSNEWASKNSYVNAAGEKGPAVFSAFAELSAKKWPKSRILWALLSSPVGLKRQERVEESGRPEAILVYA